MIFTTQVFVLTCDLIFDCDKSLISNHLPLTAVGSDPTRDFGFFLSYEEAIQLAYGTSVVLLRCPFVTEVIDGGEPEVFLHQ